MKRIPPSLILFLLCIFALRINAQNLQSPSNESSGVFSAAHNGAEHPCVTPEQYASIQKTVFISELPNGIYFLTIENEKNKIVKKIIKQN